MNLPATTRSILPQTAQTLEGTTLTGTGRITPQNTQTRVSQRDRTFQCRFDVRPFFADQRIYSTLTEPDLAVAGVRGQEIKLRQSRHDSGP